MLYPVSREDRLGHDSLLVSRLVTKISMIRLAFTEAFELTAIICSVIALILAVLAFLFLPRKQANSDDNSLES